MIRRSLFIFLLILFGIFVWFVKVNYDFFIAPLTQQGVVKSVIVPPGDHFQALSKRLYQEKIIRHPAYFVWLADVLGYRSKLQYGAYSLTDKMTAWDLLQHIVTGTGLVKYRLTLIEGTTFKSIRKKIGDNEQLKQTLHEASDTEIMDKVTGKSQPVEGWFYPDTYFFTWGNTDLSVLKRAHEKMQHVLSEVWSTRDFNLPYKKTYQALIVASLIERETSISAEKPLIASVIVNRLKKNMRLQIDPTVQYGLGKSFGSKLTKKELSKKTPYNTYLIEGLPPTPICMPSRSSIEAALHPVKSDYLYYVASGNGGHQFSVSYAEHLKAVKKYRQYEYQINLDADQLTKGLKNSVRVMVPMIVVLHWVKLLEIPFGII